MHPPVRQVPTSVLLSQSHLSLASFQKRSCMLLMVRGCVETMVFVVLLTAVVESGSGRGSGSGGGGYGSGGSR